MHPDGLDMVTVNPWRSDAVVLFNWLASVDMDQLPITHPAQQQALTDLFTRLEQETDIPGVTQQQIDAASRDVTSDMDW